LQSTFLLNFLTKILAQQDGSQVLGKKLMKFIHLFSFSCLSSKIANKTRSVAVFLFPSIQFSIFSFSENNFASMFTSGIPLAPRGEKLKLCYPERVVGGVCNERSIEPVLFLTTSSVNLHQSNANERAAATAAEIGKIKITPLCLLCAAAADGAGCAPHE
jgi:hypothetical protein